MTTPTPKINLTELLADREAGTGGTDWTVCSDGGGVYREFDKPYIAICPSQRSERGANARRIARLPDLEAAYIELASTLSEVREHLADGNIGKAIIRIDRGPLIGDPV